MQCMSLMPGPTCQMQTQTMQPTSSVNFTHSVHSEANDSPHLAHSGLRNSSSVTYFRQPPNLPTTTGRNRKCTECGMTAFRQNQMSTKSAHLSTFDTEAEIQSTSSPLGA